MAPEVNKLSRSIAPLASLGQAMRLFFFSSLKTLCGSGRCSIPRVFGLGGETQPPKRKQRIPTCHGRTQLAMESAIDKIGIQSAHSDPQGSKPTAVLRCALEIW